MSEEQFFERLDKKAYAKWSGGKALYMSDDWKFGRKAGINATIEALKEMEISPTPVCCRCGAIQGRQVATRDGRHYDDVRVFGTLDNHKE